MITILNILLPAFQARVIVHVVCIYQHEIYSLYWCININTRGTSAIVSLGLIPK